MEAVPRRGVYQEGGEERSAEEGRSKEGDGKVIRRW